MGIRLVHFDNDSLQVVRPLVDLEESDFDVHFSQFLLVYDGNAPIDSDNIVDTGNEEEESDVGVAIKVLIGLE